MRKRFCASSAITPYEPIQPLLACWAWDLSRFGRCFRQPHPNPPPPVAPAIPFPSQERQRAQASANSAHPCGGFFFFLAAARSFFIQKRIGIGGCQIAPCADVGLGEEQQPAVVLVIALLEIRPNPGADRVELQPFALLARAGPGLPNITAPPIERLGSSPCFKRLLSAHLPRIPSMPATPSPWSRL